MAGVRALWKGLQALCKPSGRCDALRPLYIVTGSDHSHAKSLLQLLRSLHRNEPFTRIVVYDLGLTAEQRIAVKQECYNGSLERFPYEQFPAYFDIAVNAGEYAWKPTIIAMEISKSLSPICWMDAGNIVARPLRGIRAELGKHGFFCSSSCGTVQDWTHPGMLQALDIPVGCYGKRRNLSAACVAFDPLVSKAANLAEEWARYAQHQEIIAPPGSNRSNHRQDQALLTLLAYRSGMIDAPSRKLREFKTHQDVDRDVE